MYLNPGSQVATTGNAITVNTAGIILAVWDPGTQVTIHSRGRILETSGELTLEMQRSER